METAVDDVETAVDDEETPVDDVETDTEPAYNSAVVESIMDLDSESNTNETPTFIGTSITDGKY